MAEKKSWQMFGWFSAAMARASRSKRSVNFSFAFLNGDNTVQARVARLVDFPHAANASARADLIGAEFVACGQSHLWVQPGLGNRKPTGGEFH
jgi:hypothetical protein